MTEVELLDRKSARASRRHQRLKRIARALHSLSLSGMTEPERDYWALRKHGHLKSCSCWMCGNPRKFEGERTVQERRALEVRDLGGLGPLKELE